MNTELKYKDITEKISALKKISEIHKSLKSVILTSYDIITKGHGGVPIAIGLKVETKESEGTRFIIVLPA